MSLIEVGLGLVPLDVEYLSDEPIKVELGMMLGQEDVSDRSLEQAEVNKARVDECGVHTRGVVATHPGVVLVKRAFSLRDVCGIW